MARPVLHIRSRPLHATSPLVLGPAPFFRLEGPVLYEGANNAVAGRYSDHHWEVSAQFVSSFECTEPTCVQFRDEVDGHSERLGPFERLHFPNGTIYADAAHFAEYLPSSGEWCRCSDGEPWRIILISPAL